MDPQRPTEANPSGVRGLYGAPGAVVKEGARDGFTLHDKYVSTVSGRGADTDRIHCICTWIQWIHHVLYLTVSGPRPDTDLIQWIQYVSHRIYHVGCVSSNKQHSNCVLAVF